MKKLGFFPLLLLSLWIYGQELDPVVIADFPGGNIHVEKITKDTIWLRPDLRDTEGEWFYWYFKISGMGGNVITFQFTSDNVFTSFGPAYTINQRNDWKWLGDTSVKENRFTYSFAESDTCAYFSMGFPYTEKDFHEFFGTFKEKTETRIDTLCFTRQGRAVEELWVNQNREAKHKVLITARHHACEMMANYVLEGMIESILLDPGLVYLRENVEFRIIPFMDKDGVENGDQGKNRIPRDHNRDYTDKSIYHVTEKLREEIPIWADGRLKIALDLHCPWIIGEYNEWIYLVGSSDPVNETEQIKFSKLLEKLALGELRYNHFNFLPFGKAWNKQENYDQGVSFDSWAQTIPGIKLCTTLEFPYANVLGTQISKENAREFGRALAYALMEFLRS